MKKIVTVIFTTLLFINSTFNVYIFAEDDDLNESQSELVINAYQENNGDLIITSSEEDFLIDICEYKTDTISGPRVIFYDFNDAYDLDNEYNIIGEIQNYKDEFFNKEVILLEEDETNSKARIKYNDLLELGIKENTDVNVYFYQLDNYEAQNIEVHFDKGLAESPEINANQETNSGDLIISFDDINYFNAVINSIDCNPYGQYINIGNYTLSLYSVDGNNKEYSIEDINNIKRIRIPFEILLNAQIEEGKTSIVKIWNIDGYDDNRINCVFSKGIKDAPTVIGYQDHTTGDLYIQCDENDFLQSLVTYYDFLYPEDIMCFSDSSNLYMIDCVNSNIVGSSVIIPYEKIKHCPLGEYEINIRTLGYKSQKIDIEFVNISSVNKLKVIDTGKCGDNAIYTIYNDYSISIGGKGDMYDYEYNKTPWYNNRLLVQNITIGDEITSIGDYAFYGLNILKKIELPNSITKIGEGAFCECGLKEIIIPDSVISIDEGAFNYCYSLQSIYIGDSLENIGDFSFERYSLSSIKVSENNMTYDSRNDCNAIIETATNTLVVGCKNTTICEGIVSIGDGAFFETDFLKYLYIPTSVVSIGDYAFGNCMNIHYLTIPNSVKHIGKYAFEVCGFYEIVVPNSVEYIGERAFAGCDYLSNVAILGSLNYIGDSLFEGCTSLKSVYINSSCTALNNIGDIRPFNSSLSSTVVFTNAHKNDSDWSTKWNSYNRYNNEELFTIYEFSYEEYLEYKNLGIIKAGELGNDICYIIFSDDSIIVFGNGIPELGLNWTDYDNIKKVIVKQGIKSIIPGFFANDNTLESVIIPDTVITINQSAFSDCTSLKSIAIPDSVTFLGRDAFFKCTSLENVTLSNSLSEVDTNTFAYCSSLKEINIPNNVTEIGDYAFYGCESLPYIELSPNITTIGYASFYNCNSLDSILVPESVETIKDYAFEKCYLKKIFIPSSVINIGNHVFDNYNLNSNLIIYTDVISEDYLPNTWQNNWNDNHKVIYNTSVEDFRKIQSFDWVIKYNLFEGINNSKNINGYNKGTSFKFLNPTKTGYTFSGWYLDLLFKKSIKEITSKTTGDLELFAKYSPDKYSITYNLNGGTNHKSNPKTYTIESNDITLQEPTKKGYTFDGWFDNSEFSGTKIETIETGSYGNRILYAKWEAIDYIVTFDPNGGTLPDEYSSGYITYQISTDTFNLEPALLANKTFNGWYYNNGKTKLTSIKKGSSTNYDLVAKWIDGVSYTIHYNANGGTGKLSDTKVTAGKDATLQAGSFKLTGKVFKSWNTEADGSGTEYLAKQVISKSFPLTEYGGTTVTLYAQYDDIKSFTINFNSNGGIIPTKKNMDPQSMSNNAYKALKANTFTKEGYLFQGWDTNPSADTVVYKDKATFSNYSGEDNETVELYAVWSPIIYTIAFNANGGKGTMSKLTATYDEDIDLQANLFTRVGYTFIGWSTIKNGQVIYDDLQTIEDNLSTKNKATVTLYAVWKANTYKITFTGEGLYDKYMNCTYDVSYKLNNDIFEQSGKTVSKWTYSYIDSKGKTITKTIAGNASIKNLCTGLEDDKDITLSVATTTNKKTQITSELWTNTKYTVKYVLNGGTNNKANKSSYTSLTNFELQAPTRKDGAIFEGWYLDQNYTEGNTITSTNGIYKNLTLYAAYKDKRKAINYHNVENADNSINPNYYTEGASLSLAKPTRTGYTFNGWYTDSALTKKASITAKTIGEINLYAKWTSKKYTITYNANGGTFVGSAPKKVSNILYDDITLYDNNTIHRDGYYLLGFSTNKNSLTPQFNVGEHCPELSSTSVTLHAVWGTSEIVDNGNVSYTLENGKLTILSGDIRYICGKDKPWLINDYIRDNNINTIEFCKNSYINNCDIWNIDKVIFDEGVTTLHGTVFEDACIGEMYIPLSFKNYKSAFCSTDYLGKVYYAGKEDNLYMLIKENGSHPFNRANIIVYNYKF